DFGINKNTVLAVEVESGLGTDGRPEEVGNTDVQIKRTAFVSGCNPVEADLFHAVEVIVEFDLHISVQPEITVCIVAEPQYAVKQVRPDFLYIEINRCGIGMEKGLRTTRFFYETVVLHFFGKAFEFGFVVNLSFFETQPVDDVSFG